MARSAPVFTYRIVVKKGRRSVTASATIWPSKPAKAGGWTCRVTLKGVKGEEANFDCAGNDGLQAHILALVYLRGAFRRLAKAGFHFLDPISQERIDPEWYFESLNTK